MSSTTPEILAIIKRQQSLIGKLRADLDRLETCAAILDGWHQPIPDYQTECEKFRLRAVKDGE